MCQFAFALIVPGAFVILCTFEHKVLYGLFSPELDDRELRFIEVSIMYQLYWKVVVSVKVHSFESH